MAMPVDSKQRISFGESSVIYGFKACVIRTCQDAIPHLTFTELGKLKDSKNYLVNEIKVRKLRH